MQIRLPAFLPKLLSLPPSPGPTVQPPHILLGLWEDEGGTEVGLPVSSSQNLQGRGFIWQHHFELFYNTLMAKTGSDAQAPRPRIVPLGLAGAA